VRPLLIATVLLLVAGCTSYGRVVNEPLSAIEKKPGSYSIKEYVRNHDYGDVGISLAFSGGGTRAAALAYGVLKELRDTVVVVNGQQRSLLEEVDWISSVSGGSFTSAYYGLHGDRIFEDFESAFLRRNVQSSLIQRLLNPLQWFRSTGRTEMAIQFYDRNIFHGATFADMRRVEDAPLIMINASDLGYGARFSFIQEYFDLLCSEVTTFPVARAVAASSAVPVLFNPVVVRNYADCKKEEPEWLRKAMVRAEQDPELAEVVRGLATYFHSEKRQYAHFVDGGITDNLGLRASYEFLEVMGDIKGFYARHRGRPLPGHFAFISVDAATDPEPEMDTSNKQPSIAETVAAMSDIQLHRYNAATLALMENTVERWAETLSTPDDPIVPHFAYISFSDLPPPQQPYFNQIPTSFSLSDEQVDRLISAGRELLRNNPDFQHLLRRLEAG